MLLTLYYDFLETNIKIENQRLRKELIIIKIENK